jgi:hypothetical protein
MEEPVIEVKHLAKQYRIGLDRTYKTSAISYLRELISPEKRTEKR